MPENQHFKIAEKLLLFRRNFGFSQQEMADKMMITRSTYSLVETGKKKISNKFIKKIKAAFPSERFEWLGLETSNIVSEPPSRYGTDTIESRLIRLETMLSEIQIQNNKLLELYGNIAQYLKTQEDEKNENRPDLDDTDSHRLPIE